MKFLDFEGLTSVLSKLLNKVAVAFDGLEERVTANETGKVSKSGDTMTGNLSMGGNKDITNVREFKGNKITTTSVSETESNVKVESLKVRDDRVDILKKTTTNDDGSTSAVSAAYFSENGSKISGDLKVGHLSSSGSVSACSDDGFRIYQDSDKSVLLAKYGSKGFNIYDSSGNALFNINNSDNGAFALTIGKENQFKIHRNSDQSGSVIIQTVAGNIFFNYSDRQMQIEPKSGLEIGIPGKSSRFQIETDGTVKIADGAGGHLKTINEDGFQLCGDMTFYDVATNCKHLYSDVTTEEKAWLENYLHNLFIDLRRRDNKSYDLLKQMSVNCYDGSKSQLDMLCELSGGVSETIEIGDNVKAYVCNNGDTYLAGSGNTSNYYQSSAAPFYSNTTMKTLYILKGVTSVGNYIFYNCPFLTEITMSDSVISIGKGAFYNCTFLTEITMPDSVMSIGDYAFYNCSSLTEITLPDSVTGIGSYVFYSCDSLTTITISDSMASIGYRAFASCDSLTTITIPSSVTSISSNAFDWSGLLSIIVNKSQDSISGAPWGAINAEVIWNG